MANRDDITTDFSLSPRLVTVALPSTEAVLQDIHDTLRNHEDDPANMIYPHLISSAGKEDLGGGVTVGITSTLQNTQLAFEQRVLSTISGTATTANADGTILNDSTANFSASGVNPGDTVINFTDQSAGTILSVSGVSLRHQKLGDGTDNQWEVGDAYKIFPTIQCEVAGGNLVAVSASGTNISPVFPTAFTQIVRTSSSSATLQSQLQLEHATFNGGVTVDITSSYSGTVYPIGTQQQPVNNTVDALAIASTRGFDIIFVVGDLTIDSGLDYSGIRFIGSSKTKTTITINSDANVTNSEFEDATVTGTLDGGAKLNGCRIMTLNYVDGFIENCILNGPIVLSGDGTAHFLNCFSGVPGTDIPTIDLGGSGSPLAIRNYNGGLKLINKNGADPVSIDLNAGRIVLDSTITNGLILVRGIGQPIQNNMTGTAVLSDRGYIASHLMENLQYSIESDHQQSGYGSFYFWDPLNGDDGDDGKTKFTPVKSWATVEALVTSWKNDVIFCLASNPTGQTIVSERIVVTKSQYSIRGPGHNFKIKPSTAGSASVQIPASVEGIELRGMVVSTATSGISNAINIAAEDSIIHDIEIVAPTQHGLVVASGVKELRLHDIVIEDCGGNGIEIGNNVSEVWMRENITIDGCGGHGIRIDGVLSDQIDIGKVRIHNNTGYGIRIENTAQGIFLSDEAIIADNNTAGQILDLTFGAGLYDQAAEKAKLVWNQAISVVTTASTLGQALIELYRLSGLDIDRAMSVSSTSRTVSGVALDIQTVSGVVTVTRTA